MSSDTWSLHGFLSDACLHRQTRERRLFCFIFVFCFALVWFGVFFGQTGGERSSRASLRFPAAASIVISIWLWLGGGSRRLLARVEASSRLLYGDHMARKRGLKDATPRTRFDEFPIIWASVYSFLLWNRRAALHRHPQPPPPGQNSRQSTFKQQHTPRLHTLWEPRRSEHDPRWNRGHYNLLMKIRSERSGNKDTLHYKDI